MLSRLLQENLPRLLMVELKGLFKLALAKAIKYFKNKKMLSRGIGMTYGRMLIKNHSQSQKLCERIF